MALNHSTTITNGIRLSIQRKKALISYPSHLVSMNMVPSISSVFLSMLLTQAFLKQNITYTVFTVMQ